MEASDGSSLQSVCMIRAAELFPKPPMEKEDSQLEIPYQELPGEGVKYLGRTDDGILALSNYRIFLSNNATRLETSVPLGLIDAAQTRDLFHLHLNCKDGSTVKCSFETAEQCADWQRRIQVCVGVPETLDTLFAFTFHVWTCESMGTHSLPGQMSYASMGLEMADYADRLQRFTGHADDFVGEVDRLGFNLHGSWRISEANKDFKLCPSYPQKLLVPGCISDETLFNVANFRGSRRLPAVVWRHVKSGAVIARCSQPEVGWLGWRNSKDEQLLQALADACAFDRAELKRSGKPQQLHEFAYSEQSCNSTQPSATSTPDGSLGEAEEEHLTRAEVRKILIVDARSYTSAVTNRARGGGCECIEYYPSAEIEFMNLGNIHVIRKSFQALRQLCASPPDVPNWLGLLERTMWLQHLSGLLSASITVCHAIEKKGRPVLVHCSDGWDRTPQIVATAQLCLDPYYRTVDGFRILVEKEWLSYGHKFSDRCGNGPGCDETNERCPVFLQWLDVVHQLHKQFPCYFEFSMGYLIKLAQHSLSCLFGTFFCNTFKERLENTVFERSFSVWPFLSGPHYRNPLYVPNRERVLWPAHNIRDLSLWNEVYLGSLGNQNCNDFPAASAANCLHTSATGMVKTRSYGDLSTGGGVSFTPNGISRRSSDPNMLLEPNLLNDTNSERNSVGESEASQEIMQAMQNGNDDMQVEGNDGGSARLFDNACRSSPGCGEDSTESGCELNLLSIQQKLPVSGLLEELHVGISNGVLATANDNQQLSETVNDISEQKAPQLNMDFLNEEDTLLRNRQTNNMGNETEGIQSQQNIWYGSVQSSTDTLVPVQEQIHSSVVDMDIVDAATNSMHKTQTHVCHIQPKVHINSSHNQIASPTKLQYDSKESNGHESDNSADSNSRAKSITPQFSVMSESIIIQPEHTKLEISISGKCEAQFTDASSVTPPPKPNIADITAVCSAGRRRTSTHLRREGLLTKQFSNQSTISRFSMPGARSLPMTPSGQLERPQIAISCPDGLAHGLSEQNIRLQQIVQEHKLREDVLLREINAMRLSLLKRTCPTCNGSGGLDNNDDEPCSGFDNAENASVCSWEAVEDRSGPSSSCTTSSSTQQLQQTNMHLSNAASVLWVPDHAVSRCTSCQTEFWLGRRKHHCRSCGQIFCADCSEYWAPLPEEKLLSPVRLCGGCYQLLLPATVTEQLPRGLLQLPPQQHQQTHRSVTTRAPTAATSKA